MRRRSFIALISISSTWQSSSQRPHIPGGRDYMPLICGSFLCPVASDTDVEPCPASIPHSTGAQKDSNSRVYNGSTDTCPAPHQRKTYTYTPKQLQQCATKSKSSFHSAATADTSSSPQAPSRNLRAATCRSSVPTAISRTTGSRRASASWTRCTSARRTAAACWRGPSITWDC